MKNTYGMELNAVVTWTDDFDDDKTHTGVLVDTIDEPMGNGHKLIIDPYDGDDFVEIFVCDVAKVVNPSGSVLINDKNNTTFVCQ